MTPSNKTYSTRLGAIADDQLADALRLFDLGELVSAHTLPFGQFGQNILIESSTGRYVLRTHAHFDWQFPTEQFFARILHEGSQVPAPWPYHVASKSDVFPFIGGFAVMPELPGLKLADPAVYDSLLPADKAAIATELGRTAAQLHDATSPVSGRFDTNTVSVGSFGASYGKYIHSRAVSDLANATNQGSVTSRDESWASEQLGDLLIGPDDFIPSVVHVDLNRNNVTARKDRDGRWTVSGVFDLMELHFGDPEATLPRQLSMFVEENQALARKFIAGYVSLLPFRPGFRARVRAYILAERLIVWEYFHRPNHSSTWEGKESLRAWLEPYLHAWETISAEY